MNKEFWKKRCVFVTGPTGLVGSWLIKDLLKLGAEVVALVYDQNPDSELYRSGDINKVKVVLGELEDFDVLKQTIKQYQTDTVFHLGAQTIVQQAQNYPRETFETNIRGTYNLLEACRIHKDLVQNIVVASSDKAYGAHEELPYKEDADLVGRQPYEVSKTCTDLLARSFYHAYELPVAVIRCGNIYGGGDLNGSRIVPGTIASLIQQEAPIIRSDGSYIRDYVYVKDVSQTYISIAENIQPKKFAGEAFNFSTGDPISVLDLVKRIQALMKCDSLDPKILNIAKAEIHSQYLCSDKIKEKINWKPQYNLDVGLKETIAWYEEFLQKKPCPAK